MQPMFISVNLVNVNCLFKLFLQNARNFQDFDCQVSVALSFFHSVLFFSGIVKGDVASVYVKQYAFAKSIF